MVFSGQINLFQVLNMKIALLCDYLEYGGAEVYAHNLVEILMSHNLDVVCFYFQGSFEGTYDKEIYKKIKANRLENKIGCFVGIERLSKVVKKALDEFRPDVIILNSEYKYFYSVRKAIKNYRVVNIVHDYRMICHNGNCTYPDYGLCAGYKSGDCYIKCHEGFSYIHIWLKLFNAKRMERIDQKLVALNIAPSMALAGKCKAYGYNSICINNLLKYQKEKQIPIEEKQDFLYIGRINRDKGILDFAKTFIRYNDARNPKTKLIIYGAIEEGFEEKLEEICKNPYIIYKGTLRHDEVLEKMQKAYSVVVPSLWVENYPTVVLEAMVSGTVVVGAMRGGIIEMLSEDRGVLYDPLDEDEVIVALEEISSLSEEKYMKIVGRAKDYVNAHNHPEIYWKNIRDALQSIMSN